MQILLPILIILSAYYLNRFIRTNSILLYVSSLFVSAFSIMLPGSLYTEIINDGTLGTSFLLIVMFTGVLKRGSKIKKQLSTVRREYAILGFILITPHAYLYIYDSIISKLPLDISAIIALLLLVPLFVTSFKIVRSKLPTSTWIKLHRIAYIAYLLIFLHAISVSQQDHIIAYYIIFGTYLFFKLYEKFENYKLIKATTITILIGATSLIFINDAMSYFEKPYDIIKDNQFQDGTYIGYSKGYHRLDTVVQVNIKDNKISYVLIEDCGCTPYTHNDRYNDAAYTIAKQIKDNNRTDIDAISGATETSQAINDAVIDALQHAIIK